MDSRAEPPAPPQRQRSARLTSPTPATDLSFIQAPVARRVAAGCIAAKIEPSADKACTVFMQEMHREANLPRAHAKALASTIARESSAGRHQRETTSMRAVRRLVNSNVDLTAEVTRAGDRRRVYDPVGDGIHHGQASTEC